MELDRTDRKILSISREVILVADHTKCGRISSVFVAPLSVVHTFVTDTAAPPVDLLSPAFYGDPDAMHAAFRWLRANDPVHRDEANGLWGVTRHADVMDVER